MNADVYFKEGRHKNNNEETKRSWRNEVEGKSENPKLSLKKGMDKVNRGEAETDW